MPHKTLSTQSHRFAFGFVLSRLVLSLDTAATRAHRPATDRPTDQLMDPLAHPLPTENRYHKMEHMPAPLPCAADAAAVTPLTLSTDAMAELMIFRSFFSTPGEHSM